MERHLCWVADVVGYIPVDLWAPGANINAITYPVGMLKKKIHPPVMCVMSAACMFFCGCLHRGPCSGSEAGGDRAHEWMDPSIMSTKLHFIPQCHDLIESNGPFTDEGPGKGRTVGEKTGKKTELINTESLQTSRISSNKSGQDCVLLNIHL